MSKIGDKEEAEANDQKNVRPWLRGQAAKTFNLHGDSVKTTSDDLPLSNCQYYELMELLIFHIHLPHLGMAQTLHILKNELPMHGKIKQQFIDRLGQIRNQVVADVQLTNGQEIQYKEPSDPKTTIPSNPDQTTSTTLPDDQQLNRM